MAYAGKNGYDDETKILYPEALDIFEWLVCKNKESDFDLSFKHISLYQVKRILEYAGYENYDMSHNGWEMDYVWKFKLTNLSGVSVSVPKFLRIIGSAASGEMVLSVDEEEY